MKRQARPVERIDNLRRGLLSRGATLIVPATLSLFALAGVTAGPALDARAAQAALEAAEARAAEHHAECARGVRLRASGALERASSDAARARALVPSSLPHAAVHGALRLAASSAGLELNRIQIGPDAELGLPVLGDRLVARTISVGARGRPSELVAWLDELRSLGCPTCVREVTLRRATGEDPHFDIQIALALLHFEAARTDEASKETP